MSPISELELAGKVLGWIGRGVLGARKRWRRRKPGVRAYWDLADRPGDRSSDEVHRVLDLWGFDQGTTIAIYLVQSARLRWHQAMPHPDRYLVIEDTARLHPERVYRAIDAIRYLASITGRRL